MATRLCPVVIGREAEMDALRTALASARHGRGHCVILMGEPGIGKSRLAREVAGWAGDAGLTVVTGRSVPAAGSAAYRPLAEALTQLFRHRPLPGDAELAPWLPVLQPLLPAWVEAGPPTAEIPANVRGEAILQVLSRVGSEGQVLVLEDLHWADPDTAAVVEYLAGNVAELPLLLVLTVRDSPPSPALEVAARLRGRPGSLTLALGRLDHDEMTAMVRACEPDAAAEVVTRVIGASEGLPLLVEDLLASPGLPADFSATVKARLGALGPEHREVIEAAAILGRHFEWQLLPAMTGRTDEAVAEALAAGVEAFLLASQDTAMRFRHVLTREAVLDSLIPPRQRELAKAALAVLGESAPVMAAERREVVTDLAVRAGDRRRAGLLLAESGRESLDWGALSAAADALRRAADLLAGAPEQAATELELVGALALAGRVEEAAALGGRLISRLGTGEEAADLCLDTHLRLTQAAIAASRWQMARHHLDQARLLATASSSRSRVGARLAVLDADVTMAAGDHETARRRAEEVLAMNDAAPDVRCHAYEILGRSHRTFDLALGRAAFESALVTAEAANLALWRLRALHELGTIDLFDHAGVDRLLEARQAAERMGAMSTAAILDLQLSAGFTCRWSLDSCDRHASSALAIAEGLGLAQVRAKALAMLAGSAGMRADPASTERYAAMSVAAAPDDAMLEGFGLGMRGMALLLAGDEEASIEPWARGMAILAKLPHAEPAAVRALWPVLLAVRGDRRAQAAVDEARRLGVAAFHLNRAMIGYAEAILAGRRGDVRRARELATQADTGWANCEGWADLSRVMAATAAAADGWADVEQWLAGAPRRFAARGLPILSGRCEGLLAATRSNPWAELGVSAREADVLRLVVDGLPNKEIAARLHLSPRTVEKHVESLLRKAGARSRTELVARLAGGRSPSRPRAPGT